MPEIPTELAAALEKAIRYRFRNSELLVEALTHPSATNEAPDRRDNQRLEFFGDAIIEFLVSQLLFRHFPDAREGQLTRLRASLVDEANLAAIAQRIGLGEFICLGRGEERSGGREKKSILADACEALVAAVYLDGGIRVAQQLVDRLFAPALVGIANGAAVRDFKTELQELVQAGQGITPTYLPLGTAGPDHDRVFTFQVVVEGRPVGSGSGRTKKEAQQEAARQALQQLGR